MEKSTNRLGNRSTFSKCCYILLINADVFHLKWKTLGELFFHRTSFCTHIVPLQMQVTISARYWCHNMASCCKLSQERSNLIVVDYVFHYFLLFLRHLKKIKMCCHKKVSLYHLYLTWVGDFTHLFGANCADTQQNQQLHEIPIY